MMDTIVGVMVLVALGLSVMCSFALVQGLVLRAVGASPRLEDVYRRHQLSLDLMIDGATLMPSLLLSYALGLFAVAPLVEILTGFGSAFVAAEWTVVLGVILLVATWKLRQMRHKMLSQDVFAQNRNC